jgi:hypothetical protein
MCWNFKPEMPIAKYNEIMMSGFYLVDEMQYGKKPDFDERAEAYARENWHHVVTMLNMMINNNETMVRESGRMIPAIPPMIGKKAVIVDVWKIYRDYEMYVSNEPMVLIGDAGVISSVDEKQVTIQIAKYNGGVLPMTVCRDDFHLIFSIM